jgi:O-antigen/teichoic acid export membrane protein
MRIRTGLLAQFYSQTVTIGLQLLSVPLLIKAWGVEGYGIWLILTAAPTYIGLADLGFVQVAAIEMTMKVAAGDREGVLRVFQSAQGFVLLVCAMIATAAAGVIGLLPVTSWLGLSGLIADSVGSLTLAALVLQVLLTIAYGIVGAGYRSVGNYATSITLASTARLLEGGALLVAALSGTGFVGAAIAILTTRIVVETLSVLPLRNAAPWLHFGLKHASFSTVREMFWPSVTFMAYSVSNMINIQGVNIVVGVVLGPAAVASLSAMRTVSRLGITASNMISQTMQQEYSRHSGAGETDRVKNLFRRHLMVTVGLVIAFLVASFSTGPWIIQVWTKGKLAASEPLFTLLLVAVAIEMVWTVLQTPLVSTNKHQVTATAFLVFSAIGLVACRLLLPEVGTRSVGDVAVLIAIGMILLCGMRVRTWWSTLPADRNERTEFS